MMQTQGTVLCLCFTGAGGGPGEGEEPPGRGGQDGWTHESQTENQTLPEDKGGEF